MKKRIIVCAQDYPNNDGGVKLMYIHTRNLQYVKHNIDVVVLNFSCNKEYIYEGIRVIPYEQFSKLNEKFDIALIHAANLKNHYKFLKKFGNKFKRFIFFFHGHEVLSINHDYSEPYDFVKKSKIKLLLQDLYDKLKFMIWRKYYLSVVNKSDYIFVSNWMKEKFLTNLHLSERDFADKMHITYNNVGQMFEEMSYDDKSVKEYDFVTIRANLDDSKYAVDIVNRIAKNTPKSKFLLIGKGKFFDYYDKADNLTWLDTTLNHKGIIEMINKSRYALMPTRTDAQGLMMCEMAAFGIPVITSNIPVCHEVFKDFENSFFIENDNLNSNLCNFENISSKCIKDTSYFLNNTIKYELDVILK